jgi:hypothetical protein
MYLFEKARSNTAQNISTETIEITLTSAAILVRKISSDFRSISYTKVNNRRDIMNDYINAFASRKMRIQPITVNSREIALLHILDWNVNTPEEYYNSRVRIIDELYFNRSPSEVKCNDKI